MESQPQNPEFRNNPKNFHPCFYPVNLQHASFKHIFSIRVESSVDSDHLALLEAS